MDSVEKVREKLPGVKYNELLSKYSTMAVGGPARMLYVAEDVDALASAVAVARALAVPYRVVGFGSDVIFSDRGFDGLVIVNRSNNMVFDTEKGRVIADSGVPLSRLILEAASRGLCGLEALYGIPGTVGGAIYVNAGSHAIAISDFLKSSSVMVSSEKVLNAKPDWFEFEYRGTKLKYKKNDFPPVILNGIFQLQRCKKEVVLDKIAEFKKKKAAGQPLGERTCGSVFKNPAMSDNTSEEGSREHSAGYLLDQAGAKKLKMPQAYVSKLHANWVINRGSSSAKDVRKLIEEMRALVEEKYKITLQEEIEYLGDWDV